MAKIYLIIKKMTRKATKQVQSILQTRVWADFKSRHSWTMHEINGLFFLKRTLPFKQHLLYAPEIPFEKRALPALIKNTRQLSRHQNVFVTRLEFLEPWSGDKCAILSHLGLVRSFEEIQPEFRQWVDLDPDEPAILAQMKQKGRYNIHLAKKHDIKVTTETDPQIFLKLFRATARRDGFSIRADHYYIDLIETLQSAKMGELRVAWYNQTPLAALIVSYYDGLASYLYGASSSLKRELMAPYLLHWEAMREAKKRGCHTYDLLAIAPFANSIPHTSNFVLQKKYAGITRFKQQFGGRPVHLLGSWDLVYNPLIYQTFRFLENIRRR